MTAVEKTRNLPQKQRDGGEEKQEALSVICVPLWLLFVVFMGSLLFVPSCQAPCVERSAEQDRFGNYLNAESGELKIDRAKPLSMAQCEKIALAHSLDLSVKNLELRLQDDKVALSLVTGMPDGHFTYDYSHRSNSNSSSLFGQTFEADRVDHQA